MTIDAFDTLFDSTPQPAATSSDYAVLPTGPAEVEIVGASIGDVPWKTGEGNESGTCLKLRLSAGRGISFVFADLPRHQKPVFRALAAALGMQPDADGKVSIGPVEGLVGRRVRIEIAHYQSKAGQTKASVKRWLPAAAPAVEQPVAPKAAAAKPSAPSRSTKPQWEHADEVPF